MVRYNVRPNLKIFFFFPTQFIRNIRQEIKQEIKQGMHLHVLFRHPIFTPKLQYYLDYVTAKFLSH